ncbi:MAG: hypothetical protein H6R17_858 [Proteobacteria bacterium]|nr:hypothetical protein [Pseudomonadota bacterium]
MEESELNCIAFEGSRGIACGPLREVARKVKAVYDARPLSRIMVFNAQTSETIEIDWRGSVEQVLNRIPSFADVSAPPTELRPPERTTAVGPGRPRLGVVAREVTLLPRHWEWLNSQPGGASVALRKLVEQARRAASSADRIRQAQDASYRFMSVMAGCLDGFEEAARALFAADRSRFEALIALWPADVGAHLRELAAPAFEPPSQAEARDA